MRKLADIVVSERLVTAAQLEEALASQALYGGSLDTNLIELTQLDELDLQPALEAAHGRPNRVDSLATPAPDALRLLDGPRAEKLRVVPMRLAGNTLDVLVNDPDQLAALDELGFVTGHRLALSVATEARIAWHLEKAYGVPMPVRLAPLVVRDAVPPEVPTAIVERHSRPSGEYSVVRRSRTSAPPFADLPDEQPELVPLDALREPILPERGRTGEPVPTPWPPHERPTLRGDDLRLPAGVTMPPPPPEPVTIQPRVSRGSSPPEPPALSTPSLPPLLPDVRPERMRSPSSPPPSPTRPPPHVLDALFARIEDLDDLARLLLDQLETRFDRVVLFSAHDAQLRGWDARGPRLRREQVAALSFDLSRPSVMGSACAHAMPYLGTLPFGEIEEALLVRIGGEWPDQVAIWPLALGGRTVFLVYGEARGGDAIRRARVLLEELATRAEILLARL